MEVIWSLEESRNDQIDKHLACEARHCADYQIRLRLLERVAFSFERAVVTCWAVDRTPGAALTSELQARGIF